MRAPEIGGDYPLALNGLFGLPRAHNPCREHANKAFMASGRDALYWIIQTLQIPQGSRVLLPAYLCEEVLKPFFDSGLQVDFYGVTESLQVDVGDLEGRLSSEVKLLLYINYFGFPSNLPVAAVRREAPWVTIVEDSTHSLLSSLDSASNRADITFASYRKLLPVPNGAMVIWDGHVTANLRQAKLRLSPSYCNSLASWWTAAALKSVWLRVPGLFPKSTFRYLYNRSEGLVGSSPRPSPMSAVSKYMMNRMDLGAFSATRRHNFRYLLNKLDWSEDFRPLFDHLPDNVCPLGFPVLVAERDKLRDHLIRQRIYAPIHWELPPNVDRNEFNRAWSISDHILTLPIDQRYGERHVARMADAINSLKHAKVSWPAGR